MRYVTIIVLVTVAWGCKKPDIRHSTTDDVNIVGYLAKHPDSFSLWSSILERTETSSFLDAYGAYTVFVPTNTGVTAWLNDNGINSVEAADVNTLKELVRFHTLEDTITTPAFKDGKLPVATMHGQFLITGAESKAGSTYYTVNRQASIVQSNIRVGNGFIHAIDHMLIPAKLTIAEQLEANADYSIFVAALKATGYYKLLDTIYSDSANRWKTVMAESNRALADSNIHSLAELRQKRYAANAADTAKALEKYVAYHVLNSIQFLGDIITEPTHLTLQPEEVISTKLINNEVLVNEDEFNGVIEKGILLVRNKSDNAATNGVWHDAGAHFAAKLRLPMPVYWDLAAFPEIMKQAAYYKKQNYRFSKSSQDDRPIKDIDWEVRGENYVEYFYSTGSSLSNFACNSDVLQIPLGTGSNRCGWVEFTTPPIIKGTYKVWICYRNRQNVTLNVKIDGQLMERPVNFGTGYPAGTDEERQAINWKKYTQGGSFAGRCVGIVTIKTTERHKIRFEALSGSNREMFFDMVHFIPANEPKQFLPRFAPDGGQVWQ